MYSSACIRRLTNMSQRSPNSFTASILLLWSGRLCVCWSVICVTPYTFVTADNHGMDTADLTADDHETEVVQYMADNNGTDVIEFTADNYASGSLRQSPRRRGESCYASSNMAVRCIKIAPPVPPPVYRCLQSWWTPYWSYLCSVTIKHIGSIQWINAWWWTSLHIVISILCKS